MSSDRRQRSRGPGRPTPRAHCPAASSVGYDIRGSTVSESRVRQLATAVLQARRNGRKRRWPQSKELLLISATLYAYSRVSEGIIHDSSDENDCGVSLFPSVEEGSLRPLSI